MKLLAMLACVAACNGFDPPPQPSGAHPIANAGTGSSYPRGMTVTLDGSGSFDPDGDALTYQWSIVQHPFGSTAEPADAQAATTTFLLDTFGTYRLQLQVSDARNTDSSELQIVAIGAITSVDAGPAGTVSWLQTAQLTGTVSTVPGTTATYAWSFVSRPTGSTATLANANTLSPTFVADATGTYVIALDAYVGDEVREDTVMVEATASGLTLGSGIVAYTYMQDPNRISDRIVYIHDVGHAEIVQVDPSTGATVALDLGPFTPRSVAVNPDASFHVFGVGGSDRVVVVAPSPFHVLSARYTSCSAKQVTVPGIARVDCFPADGTTEPISSIDMTTGVVTQVPSPVQFPEVALTSGGELLMVDGASPQLYVYEVTSPPPPLSLISHGSLAGIAPPVIAAGSYIITGNGLVLNSDATLAFDLHMPVSAGSHSVLTGDIALVNSCSTTSGASRRFSTHHASISRSCCSAS
jgi:hypothetical protein